MFMFSPIAKLMTLEQSFEDVRAGSRAGAYKLVRVHLFKLEMLGLLSKGLFDKSQLDPSKLVSCTVTLVIKLLQIVIAEGLEIVKEPVK